MSEIIELVPYQSPCISVSKMRTAESFEDWCYVHHHWLNGAPAKTCTEALLDSVRTVPAQGLER